MKTILILASNPRQDLQLGYEIHALKNIIEESGNLQKFGVVIDDAISPQNIQRLFLEHKPRIVHFCGHGSGANGLVFVNSSGKEQLVSTQALSNLFKEFNDTIECVLLNACYSEVQANMIAQHINYAIGMNQAITDDAAIFFAKGFYQALGQNKQIQKCFALGKNAIELELSKLSGQTRKFEVLDEEKYELIPEHLKPAIKVKSQLTLFPEDIARQKYIKENQENFHIGQRERPTFSQKEYRFRQILLNKVRDSWIKGFLENSLHTKELLRLEIKGRPDLVNNTFSEYQELPVDPNSSYEWLQATDIFEQMGDGRTLLILGEPGSGKTIALLKLAKKFIENAENNLSLPIPVVFNLSSWTNRKSIAEWLVLELKEKYQLSKSLAKNWIEQEQLLLLLDGLDEVEKEQRNDCSVAINEFLNSHGTTEIVVCSRFQEYESLSEQLLLRNAIYIQLLTSEHIDWYFKDTGDQLLGLKTLLKNDPEIEEFAKTPLILSIMSVTYQNYSSEAVLEQLRSPNNRYKNLFDSYIQRMLQRKKNTIYNYQKTEDWLIKLALNMKKESLFLIEKMQPSWLKSKKELRAYQTSNFLTGFIIYGIFGLINQKYPMLNFMTMGVIGGVFASFSSEIFLFEQISWSWQKVKSKIAREVLKGLIFGLIAMLAILFTLIIMIVFKPTSMINFASNVASVNPSDLQDLQLSDLQDVEFKIWLQNLAAIILSFLLIYMPFGVLNSGLTSTEIKQKTFPNQGIWSSCKNSLRVGLLIGLVVGLIFVPIFLMPEVKNVADSKTLIIGIISGGYSIGMIFVLITGGNTCIRHFNLRRILYRKGRIPWNYARFLDYASKRLLMKKVGGGYVFYHRMLMEHFAQRHQASREPVPVTPRQTS